MTLALTLAAIAVTVILVARLCAPLGLPAPIALLLVGLVASVLPFVPDVSLDPDVVLLGLLPPLLYAAALGTSLVDIRANRRAILGLSVGLVLFTTFGVALVAWWLLPIPFAVAVALGAIVAPPDAVAATAVARGIGLPRRVTTILEGESLLNDATALVTLRTAIAAAGLATHAPRVRLARRGLGRLGGPGLRARGRRWRRRRVGRLRPHRPHPQAAHRGVLGHGPVLRGAVPVLPARRAARRQRRPRRRDDRSAARPQGAGAAVGRPHASASGSTGRA